MAETRTDLLVQAKAKGFQEVQQQATKIIDAAAKATASQAKGFSKLEGAGRAYKKEIKALETQLKDLAKQQLATTRAMEGMDKGAKVYKQLGENLKNLNTQYGKIAGMKSKLQEVFGAGAGGKPLTAQDMAKGGFMQGLVQGGLHVDLQRGPGMWRQAAGMATGTMLRGFAAAPFGGVQGMQSALSGIPIVGGFLGGQFGTAMGFGEGALATQQARLGALPFFGPGSGASRRIAAARARGAGGVAAPAGGFLGREEIERRVGTAGQQAAAGVTVTPAMRAAADSQYEEMKTFLAKRRARDPANWRGEPTEYGLGLAERVKRDQIEYDEPLKRRLREAAEGPIFRAEQQRRRQAAERATRTELEAPEKKYREEQARAGSEAARRERGRPFAEVRRLGQRLGGLDEAAAIQAMTPMLQRAGGGIGAARDQNMIRAAISAQTVYGVGTETAGAFLGAGRRGGMVGARGQGGEMLAATIGDALKLGLEGSELTDYMQAMANGFESWKQTGMPINPKSIAALSSSFAAGGLGGVRGNVLGQKFAQAGQRLTQTGVQDAIDLMMLETVGGYKGGGMEQYMGAMKKLEESNTEGPALDEMVQKLYKASGGGATGTWTVREALSRKGMQMGVGEAELFVKSKVAPETLTEDERTTLRLQQAQRQAVGQGAPKGVGGLAGQAEDVMGAYGGAIRRAAALQNKQNSIGEALMPTLQGLQASSANITKAFQILSDQTLNSVTKQIERFTGSIEKIATMLDKNESGWTRLGKLVTGEF